MVPTISVLYMTILVEKNEPCHKTMYLPDSPNGSNGTMPKSIAKPVPKLPSFNILLGMPDQTLQKFNCLLECAKQKNHYKIISLKAKQLVGDETYKQMTIRSM